MGRELGERKEKCRGAACSEQGLLGNEDGEMGSEIPLAPGAGWGGEVLPFPACCSRESGSSIRGWRVNGSERRRGRGK